MAEGKIRILVVDDEADFRDLITFWLQSKGYSVSAACDGESAIRTVQEDPPDIVFLDINMPVMDGAQTLKRIREINQELPVIIISAYVEDKRAKEASSLGISGVFYKGKDFKEGLNLLESVLRTHKNLKKES